MRLNKRKLTLLLFDILCYFLVCLAYYLIPEFVSTSVPVKEGKYLIDIVILCVAIFAFRLGFGVYNTMWRYTSTRSYFYLVIADMLGGVTAYLVAKIASVNMGFWHFMSIVSMTALLAQFARYSYRLLHKRIHTNAPPPQQYLPCAIIGAGHNGAVLYNELTSHRDVGYKPVLFVDVDEKKIGSTIAGAPVVSFEKFTQCKDKYEISDVILAFSADNGEKLREQRELYESVGCRVKLYSSKISSAGVRERGVVRDFTIEDVLFRSPLTVGTEQMRSYYAGKTVLITGGGGSIGSELCRQVAMAAPKRLVLFDIYENNAYDIQQELVRKYKGTLDLCVEIGSVRDVKRLDYIFRTYRPDVVFHAAAHKHVPLMENSSTEAIKNNVLGTYNTANAAEQYGVEKFILISTDKAVNPTNVMGASKRLCEMVVQCRTDSKCAFAAVRFGNVLGSNGSVVPLFKRQIAEGGPITITDKRIIRYFMTIPEASQLVMTAGSMAHRGELFVLDMGKPVRIYDLAVNMIKLSGLTPDVDIRIEEIGLRPGEKLYEELLMKTEALDKTENEMIFIERDTPHTREEIEDKLSALKHAIVAYEEEGEHEAIKDCIRRIVPTFRDPEQLNATAESSEEMKMTVVANA